MTDFNAYLAGCHERARQHGDMQLFVREVFAARRECSFPLDRWKTAVSWLLETVFQPLIDALDDAAGQNFIMAVLGMYLSVEGFDKLAEDWLRRAADAAEGLGDPFTRCNAFSQYGTLLRVTGRFAAAEPYLKRAADAAEGIDDPLTRCNAFGLYGTLLRVTGRHAAAEPYLKRAADAAEGIDDPLTRCNASHQYGSLLRVTGRFAAAEPYLKRAADAAEGINIPLTRCNAFGEYGTLLRVIGRPAAAEHYLKRAADAAEGIDDPHTRSSVFRQYGDLLQVTARGASAESYFKRAADEAAGLDDPLTRCNASWGSARIHLQQKQYGIALTELHAAQQQLHTMLESNRYPQGISSILGAYADVFDAGVFTADQVFVETKNPSALLDGVVFADSLKAVSVREGLRRHSSRRFDTNSVAWEPGPDDWKALFGGNDRGAVPDPPSPTGRALRAVRQWAEVEKPTQTVLELPGDDDPTKVELSLPLDPAELAEVLPDDETVALVFHFLKDNLFILPVRRGADGTPRVIHTEEGYFWVPKCRPAFDQLLDLQTSALHAIDQQNWYAEGAAELRSHLEADAKDGGFDLMGVPFLLNKLLRLDDLLALIEPDPAERLKLHLVLLPDGLLYKLPLHAAAVTIGEGHYHLIDVVGSVRYALSLRTLHTLGKVEATHAGRGAVPLRGVAFVNPSNTVGEQTYASHRLAFAPREVEYLVNGSPDGSWRLFGERHRSADWLATRANMARYHPTPTLLWSVCHGGMMADTFVPRGFATAETVVNPSLLLADGPLSTARMVSEGYDLRGVELWHNSCCLLGRLESADGHRQVEGYVAALTLLGCRRVSSAMWELADHAAAEFARHFLARLRVNVFDHPARSPHAVAVSLKEAMASFRADKSNGDFDHPYYWAPYTLYGLG